MPAKGRQTPAPRRRHGKTVELTDAALLRQAARNQRSHAWRTRDRSLTRDERVALDAMAAQHAARRRS